VLRLLAVCAEEGIPPAPLLAAWARDERGGQAERVRRTADLLATGASPAQVVESVPALVTADHAVALRYGERLGLLPQVVSATLATDEGEDEAAWHRVRAGLGYLAVVVFVFSCVTALVAFRVIPQYLDIMREFEMEEPEARLAAGVSTWLAAPAALVIIPVAVLLALVQGVTDAAGVIGAVAVVTALLILAWFAGRAVVRLFGRLIGRRLVAPFLRPRRRAAALDHLGVAVAAGRPLREAAAALADCHHDRDVASRLRRVAAAERDADVAAAGLATAAEQRFVEAAGAAGAHAWGLRTLARRQRQRAARRVIAWSGMLAPVAAVLTGAVVLLEALAIFEPIVRLIGGLT
jgi:type II secretory pathway component PulF